MVEITSIAVIDKIKGYLGLRGKAIISSRNSLYPVLVVNGDEQGIPILPAKIPRWRTDVRTIQLSANQGASTAATLYTCPASKRAYITFSSLIHNVSTASSAYIRIRNSAAADQYYIHSLAAALSSQIISYAVPLVLNAGDYIEFVTPVAADDQYSIVGYEEPAV